MEEIKMIQYYDEHWYKRQLDEKHHVYYASVTTKLGIIAKYGLDRWRGDIGNREADYRIKEAQGRGSRIHKAWELYQLGQSIGYHPWQTGEEAPECDFVFTDQGEYLDFLKLHYFTEIVKPKFVETESLFFSDTHRDAGTCDNVLEIKGGKYSINGSKPVELEPGIYIGDLKSGKTVYDEAYMQIAAYAQMYTEMGLAEEYGPVVGGIILHTNALTRSGIVGFGVKVRTIEQMREDYEDYRIAANMWERKNKNACPKEFEFPQIVKYEVNK